MKKIIQRYVKSCLLLVIAFLLTACANHYSNVEGSLPYNNYIGKNIPLQSDAFLYQEWSQTLLLDPNRITGYRKDRLIHVPVGTLVTINEVELEIGFDSIHAYTAYGHINLAGHDKPVKFEYLWGWYDTIRRAPWESVTTPTKRYVGPNGLQFVPEAELR